MRFVLGCALLGMLGAACVAVAGGEIYGTIQTDRGETFTGPIRWDKNENFWDDIIDARKAEKTYSSSRGRRIRIFGIVLDGDKGGWSHSELTIPFGHIKSMEPRRRDKVDIVLKNDEVLRLKADGSDLGDGMRGLVIYDKDMGEIDLDWDEVDLIEFSQGPGEGLDNERLYGTVETDAGDFTGFIVWDRDEAVKDDILDGDDDGRDRKIPFARIKAIEPRRDGSRITLQDGRQVFLDNSNDVDDDNRGIDVTVTGLGVVKVQWDEFIGVTFKDAPPSRPYSDFDGGHKLYGTVQDDRGRTYTGRIIWDNDEELSWEALNGRDQDVEFAILFENIRSIKRESRRSAEVQLKNGEVLLLRGSNDVDRDNKGIRVEMEDGSEVELDWSDFESVEFSDP